MKNPFEKKDNTALIASVAIGSIVTGVATWLFMTEKGSVVREQISAQLDKLSALLKSKPTEEEPHEHPHPHNHPRPKAPKTDREALLHNEILHAPHTGNSSE